MIDESTEFGARAARRLREELLAWLTTVDGKGTPQPIPVWFLWDGDRSVLIYSRPDTAKLRNIEGNPRASLHLDGNRRGGDVIVCLGTLGVSEDPPGDRVPEYAAKYSELIERNRWSAESFAANYSVPLRLSISRIRGH
jgi:PPOX class probable F420-dependent enzyme